MKRNMEEQIKDEEYYPSTALCIVTKNSADVIDDTLEQTIDWYVDHNIDIYYYDASDDDSTEKVVMKYKEKGYENLYYLGYDPEIESMERMHMIINEEGLYKKYDYIWPSKNGSFVDSGCMDRVIIAEKQEYDVILIDIFGNKGMKETGASVSPEEFYFNRGILAMSWDTMVLRTRTMAGGVLWKDSYTIDDHEFSFGLFEHVFRRLAEIDNPKVMALYDAVIYHSRLRLSGFHTNEGLRGYMPIWEDRWIEANESLPQMYDKYKEDVIHDANVPWVLGSTDFLKKVHAAGGLTPDNLDHVLENWERVSDIPVEELRRIAYGEYEGSPENWYVPEMTSEVLVRLRNEGMLKKISVIVPCYNVEDRLRECLDSIVKQSYGIENLEIILVDDASMDSTTHILKEFERRYPDSIKLILLNKNGRQGAARNIGLTYATGDWISFVDADDMIHLQMYEVLMTIVQDTDPDMITFDFTESADALDTDYSTTDIGYDIISVENIEDRKEFVLRGDLINDSCWRKLYKRKLLEKTRSFYAEGVSYEEPLFTYPFRYTLNKIVITDLPLYYYHLNPNGTINSTLEDPNTIKDHLSVQNQLLEFLREQEYYVEYKDEIEINYLHRFVYEPHIFLNKRGYEFPDSLLKDIMNIANKQVPDWIENPYLMRIPEEEYKYILQMKSLEK